MDVIKASGERQPFNERKLAESLRRSGASPEAARRTVTAIKQKFRRNIPTQRIYRLARQQLYRLEPKPAIRYSLKHAIFALGPTGFPFEKYIAQVLNSYDYDTKINQFIAGRCIEHEIDVLARKNGTAYFVECKYHKDFGGQTGSQVMLYTYARYLDLKNALDVWQDEKAVWLITNTRCTSRALHYAECNNMRVTAWRYPVTGGLEQLIEANELYPVTILPGLSRDQHLVLINDGLILVQDLLTKKTALQRCRLPRSLKDKIVGQAQLLLSHES